MYSCDRIYVETWHPREQKGTTKVKDPRGEDGHAGKAEVRSKLYSVHTLYVGSHCELLIK